MLWRASSFRLRIDGVPRVSAKSPKTKDRVSEREEEKIDEHEWLQISVLVDFYTGLVI